MYVGMYGNIAAALITFAINKNHPEALCLNSLNLYWV